MDPIPQMIVETPAARRKGELVITLANAAELRAAIDKAEHGLLAARAAMDAVVEAIVYCGSTAPESGRECDRPEGHPEPHRSGMVAWDGQDATVKASAEPTLCTCDHVEGEHLDDDGIPGYCSLCRVGACNAFLAAAPEPAAPRPVCECGDAPGVHHLNVIMDQLTYCNACNDCEQFRPAQPAPLASVTPLPLRPDYEVIPALQVPCNEAHPTRGTLCTGKVPHPMPHADEDGKTWVTERQEATL